MVYNILGTWGHHRNSSSDGRGHHDRLRRHPIGIGVTGSILSVPTYES